MQQHTRPGCQHFTLLLHGAPPRCSSTLLLHPIPSSASHSLFCLSSHSALRAQYRIIQMSHFSLWIPHLWTLINYESLRSLLTTGKTLSLMGAESSWRKTHSHVWHFQIYIEMPRTDICKGRKEHRGMWTFHIPPALEDNTGGCWGDIDTYIYSINWDSHHKSKECSKNTGSFRIELSKKIKSHKRSQEIYKQATSTEQNKNNILVIWEQTLGCMVEWEKWLEYQSAIHMKKEYQTSNNNFCIFCYVWKMTGVLRVAWRGWGQ